MRRLFSLLFTLVLSLPFVLSVSTTSKNKAKQKQKLEPSFWDIISLYPSSLSPSLTSSRFYQLIFEKKEGCRVKIEDRRADDRDDDDAAAAEAVEKERLRNPGKSKDCFFPA